MKIWKENPRTRKWTQHCVIPPGEEKELLEYCRKKHPRGVFVISKTKPVPLYA